MRDYYDARTALLASMPTQQTVEYIDLFVAEGRVLGADCVVQYNAPQFDNSAMDGYALCDLEQTQWQVVGTIAAGDDVSQFAPLAPGQAYRIFTGAGVPAGTDTVIQQERVQKFGNHDGLTPTPPYSITVDGPLSPAKNIRYEGEELRQGAPLLKTGHPLSAAAIGLLASQGYAQVPCFKPLKVTVFSTGDELVPLGQPLLQNTIYDSNRPMLLSQLQRHRFLSVTDGQNIPDDLDLLRKRLYEAAQHQDVLVFSGGASVGERDYLKQALNDLGQVTHWQLAIKPGKPFGWGRIERSDGQPCHVFLLPGNPVASYVTCHLLAVPAMRRASGMDLARALPQQAQAQAGFEVNQNRQVRRDFRRGVLRSGDQGLWVELLGAQDSHMLSGITHADVLIEIPPSQTVAKGDLLTIYPLP